MIRTDKTLDVKGMIGPRLETLAQKTLAGMQSGQVLTVITTDGMARRHFPPLCERLGCRLLESGEERGALYFQILKGA